jgi:hypothetical protein
LRQQRGVEARRLESGLRAVTEQDLERMRASFVPNKRVTVVLQPKPLPK